MLPKWSALQITFSLFLSSTVFLNLFGSRVLKNKCLYGTVFELMLKTRESVLQILQESGEMTAPAPNLSLFRNLKPKAYHSAYILRICSFSVIYNDARNFCVQFFSRLLKAM